MDNHEQLVKALRKVADYVNCYDCDVWGLGECDAKSFNRKSCVLHNAADAIEALQAQLPKRGEWKTTDAFPHRVYCSNCFRTYVPNDRWQIWVDKPGEGGLERNYCPSCGAKMEVQE